MANVNLILLDDVEKLGLAGDEVSVAPGYARNYLLPRGLAAKATPGTLRLVESRKAMIAERRAKELADAKALAAKVAELELSIAMQADEGDQLFGSVTARMVADELAKQGIAVEHGKVKMDPIKNLGNYEVEVKLHADVTATLKVWVVRG
ncbi:MAG: 50S ribosomal protein L9 [Lentisphaeria bacterium]|nr:50S ribosomal protein L9 [Lentisphaeria bacterium]MBQ8756323.1 50S ribosomal protein L9 [Lentisphaeria bacterium]MBQ9776421.1 50S ribosomal protein L9 [Lentisphaeria bacterium]